VQTGVVIHTVEVG